MIEERRRRGRLLQIRAQNAATEADNAQLVLQEQPVLEGWRLRGRVRQVLADNIQPVFPELRARG